VEFATHKEARVAAESMNGFELMQGQKLKVNILTDGPRDENGAHKEEDLGEDTTNTYLHSAQDRTALMQKLSRNKDSMIPGGEMNQGAAGASKSDSQNASRPSNCLLFQGMFDTTQVDLKKEPAFFMDIKDQVHSVCSVWVQFKDDDITSAAKTQYALDN